MCGPVMTGFHNDTLTGFHARGESQWLGKVEREAMKGQTAGINKLSVGLNDPLSH